METSAIREIHPITGFDFACSILEHKGDEAVEILLRAAKDTESDWLEKKAAVYRSESKDKDEEYWKALKKCCDPKEIEQTKESLNNELLAIIAIAVVAIHNSRGGVLFIGIDDTTNEPVSFAENDGGRIWMNGKDEYARKAIQDRLFRENKEFKCPKESWIVPTKEIGVISKWCHYKEADVLALIIPPLPLEKYPLEIECIKNSTKRRFVPCRSAGDVGRVKKVEIKEVNSVAQLNDYLIQRQELFLDREDLFVKLKELGLSVSYLPVIPSIEAPTRPVFSSVNQPYAKNFVGREKELAELHSLLQKGRIPVVTGPGGTGKSELVLQYAEQHKSDYSGGLFQIDMETAKSWDAAFRLLLETREVRDLLGFSKSTGEDTGGDEVRGPSTTEVARVLARRANGDGHILLVLDNIESVKAFLYGPVFENLSLPNEVCLIATARTADVNFRPTDRAIEYRLSDLSPKAALELLLKDHPAQSDAERAAAEDIAKLLNYRALHLRAIPALLDDPYSAYNYNSLKTDLQKDLQEMVNAAMEDYGEGARTPSALWALTCKALFRHSMGATWIKLAHVASFFSADGFRKHILRHLWGALIAPEADNDRDFDKALDVLKRHGLLSDSNLELRMHRLNAEALRRSALEDDAAIEETIGKTLAGYDGMSPDFWLSLSDCPQICGFIPELTLQSKDLILAGCGDSVCAPSLQVRLLLKNRNCEKVVRWQLVNCSEWLTILERNPDFASRPEFSLYFSWDKLNGNMWARLLGKRPQFANYCLWDKLNGSDWAVLLSSQPQFKTKADELRAWETLGGRNWAWLLTNQPDFSRLCHWEELDSTSWGCLLGNCPQFRRQFETYSKWEKLEGTALAMLLGKQPQFAEYCDLGKLRSDGWARLLQSKPQFADHCLWELFEYSEWFVLLGKQPQFADRCPKEFLTLSSSSWLSRDFWSSLLQKQPQLAKLCLELNPNPMGWALVLSCQPNATDGCPWEKFGGRDWAMLLARQPQFADRCQWSRLNNSDWAELLKRQPQFAHLYSGWEQMDCVHWAQLLESQPQLAPLCSGWEQMDGSQWAELLERQPQLAHYCSWWGKLDDSDWNNLLLVQPQFAIYRNSGQQSS